MRRAAGTPGSTAPGHRPRGPASARCASPRSGPRPRRRVARAGAGRRSTAVARRSPASSSPSGSGRRRAATPLVRSYSLRGSPGRRRYRISVKVEPRGAAGHYVRDGVDGRRHRRGRRSARIASSSTTTERPVVLVERGRRRDADAGDAARAPRRRVRRARSGGCTAPGTEPSTPSPTRRHRCCATSPHVHRCVCYSRPDPTDRAGTDYDEVGRITAEVLRDAAFPPTATTTCADRPRSWTTA